MSRPVLALTQGDPAGIGPEILLKVVGDSVGGGGNRRWQPLLVAERAALKALRPALPDAPWSRLRYLAPPLDPPGLAAVVAEGRVPVLDPVGRPRTVTPGHPTAADAAGALAALDAGVGLVWPAEARIPLADALVTAPLSKAEIARELRPDFRGHTDYLAAGAGLERYGRDYLMTFLTPELKVALLSTHLPLRDAVAAVRREAITAALRCLHRHLPDAGRIAVAGLNPHAGEGGLLGREDEAEVRPAVAEARREGIDVHGPESADSLFARARRGEFDWVLALYHDQGLIAVKTAGFGTATNRTLGLPYLRTSVDHGTAYGVAGRGVADAGPLRAAVAATLGLIAERRGDSMPSSHDPSS